MFQPNDAFGAAFFHGFLDPHFELAEVTLDFKGHLLRKRRKFGAQEGGDADGLGLIANAFFPVENVGVEALERTVNALGEIAEGCAELVAMLFEDGGDQNLFGGKVVMDAWLTNFDHLCDIRITERRVAAIGEEGVSGFEDSICGITLHGGILPTGRYRCN